MPHEEPGSGEGEGRGGVAGVESALAGTRQHEESREAGAVEGEGRGGRVGMKSAVAGTQRLKLSDVNTLLACELCSGYLVDATTIVECLHSFCRSCIIKFLETNNFCPICDVPVHKAKMFLNIKPDKTLQDIVYKLVPGLFQAEMRRRRDFYSQHPEQVALTTPEERGVGVERIIYSPEDSISLSLEYYASDKTGEECEGTGGGNQENGAGRSVAVTTTSDCPEKPQQVIGEAANGVPPTTSACSTLSRPATRNIPHKRYLQCPAVVTIGHLKKFLRLKFDLSAAYRVDIIHRAVCLPEDYTLMDVAYIYTWKRSEPMEFMYRIHEPPRTTIRRKKRPASELVVKEALSVPGKVNGHISTTENSQELSRSQESSDDPPPPKLERMEDNPVPRRSAFVESDRDGLLPPRIDRPGDCDYFEDEKSTKPQNIPETIKAKDEPPIMPADGSCSTSENKVNAEKMSVNLLQDTRTALGKNVEKSGESLQETHPPISRPHSTPGAAAQPISSRPLHPQQQQLPSPRPASSPPALVPQHALGSAQDDRREQTPVLRKDSTAAEPQSSAKDGASVPVASESTHPDRKRPHEPDEVDSDAKRDGSGALDLSGGSSRLSGGSSPPTSPSASLGAHSPSIEKDSLKNNSAAESSFCRNPSSLKASPAVEPVGTSHGASIAIPAVNPTKQGDVGSESKMPNKPAVSVAATQANSLTNTSSSISSSPVQSTPLSSGPANVSTSSSEFSPIITSPKTCSTPTKTSSTSTTFSTSPSVTSYSTTTSTASTRDATTVRVSTVSVNGISSQPSASPGLATRLGKVTKGQSTQTLQSIAENLARNVQQKQLQQQQQQQLQHQQQMQQKTAALAKSQSSNQQQQKPLQQVQPLQSPKYTPHNRLQQQLQQQGQHLTEQQQILHQHAQQQLHQHLQQLQLQQHLQQQKQNSQQQLQVKNHTLGKSSPSTHQKNISCASTQKPPSTPPSTITIPTKVRQGSPHNRCITSPVNAVSPHSKPSSLTVSVCQVNNHGTSSSSRPSPKRGSSQVSCNTNFLQQSSSVHHHLLHPLVTVANNPATSPDPLSPMSSISPFAARSGSLRSPPPPLAPPPPPPPPSHHNSHPGTALRIPVPPSGKPRPSSLSSSSPSPSPPGDHHSSTPSPNGHSSLAHQKVSTNGSPGLSGRLPHELFAASHHLHSGNMFSPHGLRLRQQMEMQNRHLVEQHFQQAAAHQQSSATSPTATSAMSPQLLQQWHQLQQLHLRHQQQQSQNANVSQTAAAAAALTTGGYPMEWYTYPQSVKLFEYLMKLGPLPMFPFNNNTSNTNNNSSNNSGRK